MKAYLYIKISWSKVIWKAAIFLKEKLEIWFSFVRYQLMDEGVFFFLFLIFFIKFFTLAFI